MKRTALVFAALAVSGISHPAEDVSMWGCAPGGERRSVLVLADRGAGSYIKFSGQRINAALSSEGPVRKWSFGRNHFVLTEDLIAEYYEQGALKARFKCRVMSSR